MKDRCDCGCHQYAHSLPRSYEHTDLCYERRRIATVQIRGFGPEYHSNGENLARFNSERFGSH